jgi:hypothetical protein
MVERRVLVVSNKHIATILLFVSALGVTFGATTEPSLWFSDFQFSRFITRSPLPLSELSKMGGEL